MPEKILLAHGSGGRLTHDLVREIFLPHLSNPFLEPLDDSARLMSQGGPMAFPTDSYVVNPIFFPGGDIGKLSVFGTINDLSMAGAVPSYLSLSLIIEEGFPVEDLKRLLCSDQWTGAEAVSRLGAGLLHGIGTPGTPGIYGSQEAFTRRLSELGIPGLSYLDAASRGAGDGTRNFVVWDQDLLDEMARRMAGMAENKK